MRLVTGPQPSCYSSLNPPLPDHHNPHPDYPPMPPGPSACSKVTPGGVTPVTKKLAGLAVRSPTRRAKSHSPGIGTLLLYPFPSHPHVVYNPPPCQVTLISQLACNCPKTSPPSSPRGKVSILNSPPPASLQTRIPLMQSLIRP